MFKLFALNFVSIYCCRWLCCDDWVCLIKNKDWFGLRIFMNSRVSHFAETFLLVDIGVGCLFMCFPKIFCIYLSIYLYALENVALLYLCTNLVVLTLGATLKVKKRKPWDNFRTISMCNIHMKSLLYIYTHTGNTVTLLW